MSKQPLKISGLLVLALSLGYSALGSTWRPSQTFLSTEVTEVPGDRSLAALSPPKKKSRKPQMDVWSRFRPSERDDDNRWAHTQTQVSLTTYDKIFNKEISRKLNERWDGAVRPLEAQAYNPYFRSENWERERYENSRKEMANWTLKEVGQAQLKDFLRRKRNESAAMDVVAATSGLEDKDKANKDSKQLREERLALANAGKLSEEEESIPTRLRAKLNLLKTKGQLTFMNPVVTTSVEARAGSGENLAVEMNRDFRKMTMTSKVRYGVDENFLVMNVNKKITDEVSLDLNSERWTGSKRGSAGEKTKETAKVVYSISF